MHGRRRRSSSRRLKVLFSFPAPHAATNPYIVQMARAVAAEPAVDVLFFSWRNALLRRFDVFHTQWPELLFSGPVAVKTVVRQALFVLLMGKLRLFGIPMVRTLHNLRPHERKTRMERLLIGWVDRRTAAWIRLNPSTVPPPGPAANQVNTILHGHYREWFSHHERHAPVPGSVVFAGQIRAYKNVPQLISAFTVIADEDWSLRIVGKPTNASMQRELVEQALGDERISFGFGHVSDEQLVREVSQAALVVLPYADMHNSGAALLALSLDRPILVPANDVTAALAAEVGNDWVQLYPGSLRPADLRRAVEHVERPRSDEPDLSHRDWASVGAAHVAVYRRAVGPFVGDQHDQPIGSSIANKGTINDE